MNNHPSKNRFPLANIRTSSISSHYTEVLTTPSSVLPSEAWSPRRDDHVDTFHGTQLNRKPNIVDESPTASHRMEDCSYRDGQLLVDFPDRTKSIGRRLRRAAQVWTTEEFAGLKSFEAYLASSDDESGCRSNVSTCSLASSVQQYSCGSSTNRLQHGLFEGCTYNCTSEVANLCLSHNGKHGADEDHPISESFVLALEQPNRPNATLSTLSRQRGMKTSKTSTKKTNNRNWNPIREPALSGGMNSFFKSSHSLTSITPVVGS